MRAARLCRSSATSATPAIRCRPPWTQAVAQFGGIDICVNNASAINLGSITEVPLKRFDLMNGIQVRGTYAVSAACIPHMLGRDTLHILTLSPPIRLEFEWLKPHRLHDTAKFGITLCALGIAEEMRAAGIASNTPRPPRTLVATAAVQNLLGGDEAMGRDDKSPTCTPTPPTWCSTSLPGPTRRPEPAPPRTCYWSRESSDLSLQRPARRGADLRRRPVGRFAQSARSTRHR